MSRHYNNIQLFGALFCFALGIVLLINTYAIVWPTAVVLWVYVIASGVLILGAVLMAYYWFRQMNKAVLIGLFALSGGLVLLGNDILIPSASGCVSPGTLGLAEFITVLLILGGAVIVWMNMGEGKQRPAIYTVIFAFALLGLLGFLLFVTASSGASSECPTKCIAASGYYCQNPTLGTSGTVGFALGQSSGVTQYNIGLACAAKSNNLGRPYAATTPANVFYYPTSSGSASRNVLDPATTLSLTSGEIVNITSLPCLTATGLLTTATSWAEGTGFTASLWYNYTTNASAPGPSNPWHTVKIATVTFVAKRA